MSTPTLDETRTISLAISLEEITPHPKRRQSGDKGKEKVGASIWDDTKVALMRAHNVVTAKKLKEILGVPSHEMVNRHIHKLVQVSPLLFILSIIMCVCVYIYIYIWILDIASVLIQVIARCWERRFISPWSIWLTRRRLLWLVLRWRHWRPRVPV